MTKSMMAGLAMLALQACICKEEWPLQYSEALLVGYSDLTCEFSDGDNSTLDFSYRIPEGVSSSEVLDSLQGQVQRSMARRGAPTPQTCFRVVARSPTHLLLVCDQPSVGGGPYAWLFIVEQERLRATIGPARFVQQLPEVQEVPNL